MRTNASRRRAVTHLASAHVAVARMASLRVISATLGLFLAACGGDDPVAVATVSVTPATATVSIGATSQLTASPVDASGAAISGRKVTWTTSNASTATVSTGGLVTGVAAGTALISAAIDGVVGNASITVSPPPVATVAITPAAPSMVEGDTLRLRTTLTVAGGAVVTGRVVTWTSGTPAVATISNAGLITALAAGTSTITATSEGKTATVSLTVTQSPCNIGLATPIRSGVPITGTLATTDCAFGDGTFLDIYSFTLAAQATLDVQMKSTLFDAYLIIYRVNATDLTKVGENDDENPTGTNTDARLTGTLSAGNYIIVANGFVVNQQTQTLLPGLGQYTVSFTSPFTAPLNAFAGTVPSVNSFSVDRVAPERARMLLRTLRRPQ